jgi:hypothetical protein
LVEECHLFVAPMVVGGVKQSLPDNVRLKLELLDERRFRSGMVYLFYRTRTYPCFPSPENDSRDLHKLGVWVCGANGREASLVARGIRQGYGEEVALALALRSVGFVLWRVVAGLLISDRVPSLGPPASSVLSMVVEGDVCSAGSAFGVWEE